MNQYATPVRKNSQRACMENIFQGRNAIAGATANTGMENAVKENANTGIATAVNK